jgi:hypothetical protein
MTKKSILLVLVGLTLPTLSHLHAGSPQGAGVLDKLLGLAEEEQLPDPSDIDDSVGPVLQGKAAADNRDDVRGRALGLRKKLRPHGSSSGVAKGDFNGDGFADLAIGVPGEETPSGVPGAGAVVVIYGSADGLTATNPAVPASQFWSQNADGVPSFSQATDNFGAALAAGEFNGDRFSDLAIGVPSKHGDSGGVIVIYGSSHGLAAASDTRRLPAAFFDLGSVGKGSLADFEEFGRSLAWGDFNGDGVGDLAIGAPGFSTAPFVGDLAGAVTILFGSTNNGLTTAGHQFWTEGDVGLGGSVFGGVFFAEALAAGDFNGDSNTDLAIGVPDENSGILDINRHSGRVLVLYGAKSVGLKKDGAQAWSKETPGILGDPVGGEEFGSVLAAGDFNGDGKADLAVGVPNEKVSGHESAGGVSVIYGSASGLTNRSDQHWTQDGIHDLNSAFASTSETDDQFGFALAAGDFNDDGKVDLAIGVPGEGITFNGSTVHSGEVDVLYGSDTGLSATIRTPQRFHQATSGIPGDPQSGDRFGSSLTAWNFGRNEVSAVCCPELIITHRTADLAIGLPSKTVGGDLRAGAVCVIYGSTNSNGLTATSSQVWTQDSPGVPGAAETDDDFGFALY